MKTFLIKDTFISPLGVKTITEVAIVNATNKANASKCILSYFENSSTELEGFELVELLTKQKTLLHPTAHLHNNKAGRKAIDPILKKVPFISYIKASYLEPFNGQIPKKIIEQIDNSIINILVKNSPKK